MKKSYKDKAGQYFKILLFVFLLSIPICLTALPANFFDKGDSICFSVMLFDTECYGCGMTRALMHLLHFDFSKGIDYNKLSVIVFPLLMMLWLKLLCGTVGIKIFKWF